MFTIPVPQAFALALQHHRAGRWVDAEALYRQILAVQPDHADALHHLGIVAHQTGRHDLAVEFIGKALVLVPDNPAAHFNLAAVHQAQRHWDEAIACYQRALQLQPHSPQAWHNLGNVFADQGHLDEAIAAYRQALQLEPNHVEAHGNLGIALAAQGRFDEAIEACRRAVELRPDLPETHNNLGNALRDGGHVDEAMAAYHRALQLKPDYALAHNNLGSALRECGQLDEATAAYHEALRLQPAYPEAHNNLGNALRERGLLDEAMAAYQRALEFKPGASDIHSNLLVTALYHPAFDQRALREGFQRWGQQHAQPLRKCILPHDNDSNPSRPLRIGYVSPDFRDHVVGRNVMPLFQHHDRAQLEILCYSGVVKPDDVTEEFRQRADHWRNTVGASDELVADMIRRDRVDILVDLALHMAGNRLLVFARQPAPVQVSFAAYPGSTELEAIQYRMSDRYLEGDLPNEEAGRKERVCLIDSFWCYDPNRFAMAVNGLPALERGHVTFGSLNAFCKINEPVLKLWARVLERVKDSRLVLLTGPGSHRRRAFEILQREGIAAHRVKFMERCPRRAYLELYRELDIVLDPFPYNGHTTSLDALWMGVPVVSLAGGQIVSRAGLSQLSNLGLPELVAFSEDVYVRIAAQLAHDLPRLAELRAMLRPRMEASLLMDAPRFTRNIEAVYRTIWQRWCKQQS